MIQISCFANQRVTCPPNFTPRQWASKPSALRFPPGTAIIEELPGGRKWNKVEVSHMGTYHIPHAVLDLEFTGNDVKPVPLLFVKGPIARGRAEY